MPKYLPCRHCHTHALATRKPDIFHTAGFLSSTTITYLCKRCGRTTSLTAAEFNLLPSMTREEIAAATCDLTPDPEPDPNLTPPSTP